jgi:GntR family transcriptional regulator/MocR family aminotransferase
VTPNLEPRALSASAMPQPESGCPVASFRPDSILPFQMGLPALDAFPRKLWARLAARVVRATQQAHMIKEVAFGAPALRSAIASYLQLSRGIDCTADQVFISPGYRESAGLTMRALLQPGEEAWIEDPCFPPTRHLLAGLGMRAVPVRVDGDGIDVARGIAAAPHARAAIVTPAHQSPLTVTLSGPRRAALLAWARAAGSWIVEDDYDGEFRYTSRPLPALASLDRDGRVIYLGTFSKVLFPSLRLDYVVVPLALVERFEDVWSLNSSGSPVLTQEIVSEFIQEGHFVRHIQRMRRLYGERRELVAAALERELRGRLAVTLQAGGMHLLASTAPGADRDLAARLQRQGMAPLPLSPWYAEAPPRSALLMSFTNVATAAHAAELGRRVAEAAGRD